jgi:hypothetical protein
MLSLWQQAGRSSCYRRLTKWYMNLHEADAARIEAAVDAPEASGPALGRPLVD